MANFDWTNNGMTGVVVAAVGSVGNEWWCLMVRSSGADSCWCRGRDDVLVGRGVGIGGGGSRWHFGYRAAVLGILVGATCGWSTILVL